MPELNHIERDSVFRRSTNNILAGVNNQSKIKGDFGGLPSGIDHAKYMKKKNIPSFFDGEEKGFRGGDHINVRKMRDYDLQD